ncbi:MAG: NAD(P)/FAD-dependent oxidoreductase [Hyphomicrobiaceae bacterium]
MTGRNPTKKTQIVVVGGGAGGLELVARLGARYGRASHDIILIERNQTHVWKPLLHEVAAGTLDANLDEVGYRSHAHRWGYRFFFGTMSGIDRDAREVIVAPLVDIDGTEITGEHRIRYDYLVLAVGAVSNDFGIPGVKDHCLFLDSRNQADTFRQRLLNQCLRVSRAWRDDPATDDHVDIAIVGGGATGVELAAELHDAADGLRHYGLEAFDKRRIRITLLEGGPRILPALPEKLADAAHEELEALGIRVLADAGVTEVTDKGMQTKSGEFIPADLKVWAAGVRAPDMLAGLGDLETSRTGQLVVRPTLQSVTDDRIYALGDCCACHLEGEDKPVPPRAQAAHQMADTVRANLGRQMEGKPLEDFIYRDHGSLVSLSRFSTVGSLMGNLIGGRMAIEGRLARFVYVSLYRMHLIAIHGWFKGLAMIAMGQANKVIRPKLKLH